MPAALLPYSRPPSAIPSQYPQAHHNPIETSSTSVQRTPHAATPEMSCVWYFRSHILLVLPSTGSLYARRKISLPIPCVALFGGVPPLQRAFILCLDLVEVLVCILLPVPIIHLIWSTIYMPSSRSSCLTPVTLYHTFLFWDRL